MLATTPSTSPLLPLLQARIAAAGGKIPFAEYMDLALYAPKLGYYTGDQLKFGAGGDFVTAPEISSLFSVCLANQCEQVLQALGGGSILELGAGSGRMAVDLLHHLASLSCLPTRYYILEISKTLRARQRAYVEKEAPEWISRIEWVTDLSALRFSGIVLANEVLDALPVQRFQLNDKGIQEMFVGFDNGELISLLDEPQTPGLKEQVEQLPHHAWPIPYTSEIHCKLGSIVADWAQCLDRGVILFIDYGFSAEEYYHPDRSMGTLMCHYEHRAHADPLLHPGLQDLTAHIDFSAVAQAADQCGLSVSGFTTQAKFLLSLKLLEEAEKAASQDPVTQYNAAQAIKTLLLPSEMGELIKVLALSRDFDQPLIGFSLQGHRL